MNHSYGNIQDIEMDDLAKHIFKHDESPLPAKSILVNFEAETLSGLFTRLMELFHIGSKLLYANSEGKVDIMQLTESEIHHMWECMMAMGISMTIKRCKLEDVYRLHETIFGVKIYNYRKFKDVYKQDDDVEYPFDFVELEDVINYRYQTSPELKDWRYSIEVSNKYYVVIYFEFWKEP